MKAATLFVNVFLAVLLATASSADENARPVSKTPDLEIRGARVSYLEDLGLLVFEQTVAGNAGGTAPTARGRMDGAPVLGYVFPTTLKPRDVGFGDVEGIVALAATSHPDFDDTPLWDENQNFVYDDDGVTFHSHWVLLVKDERVPGGLAVREFRAGDEGVVVPPTHPGMPMYLDSPGFSVVRRGNTIRVLVPESHVRGATSFKFDAVAVYMEVNQSDASRPLLGVYEVYSVLSKDLSLPFAVETK